MKIHYITRVSRGFDNLLPIANSIFPAPPGFEVQWHLLIDTANLQEIDTSELQKIYDLEHTKIYFFKSSNDYLHPAISKVTSKLTTGFVYILDDDNILHPDFYREVRKLQLRNKKFKGLVFDQLVDGKDFSGLGIRKAHPDNMKIGEVDSAQALLHVDFYKKYEWVEEYVADSRFLEKVYEDNSEDFVFLNELLSYYNYISSASPTPTVPKILYIGEGEPELKSIPWLGHEDTRLNVKYLKDDTNLNQVLYEFKPDGIISNVSNFSDLKYLCSQPFNIRKKWFNIDNQDLTNVGETAYRVAMNQILENDTSSLVSYFTPTYNTGEKLWEVFDCLKRQTYNNWEWVVVNDSNDNGKTENILNSIAKTDPRVKVYQFKKNSEGIIGDVKYKAACLCEGAFLAELDHDDFITEDCTNDIIQAANRFPECGFFYGDSVELGWNWEPYKYPEGFCYGYGKYRQEYYKDHLLEVVDTPNINPITIRHIVGVPNHIRVWRRSTYFEAGGHNRYLSIADDYELIVRTFLITRFCKIPKLTYLQHIYSDSKAENTHETTRADIQRRVRTIALHYNDKIKDRFEELGLADWAYGTPVDRLNSLTPRWGKEEQAANKVYEL